jgi:hypothetical protein
MAGEKITISWNDVRSERTDAKVKKQEVYERVREHQERIVLEQKNQHAEPNCSKGSLWMKSVFFMAVFGFAGSLLAWGLGEIIRYNDPLEKLKEMRAILRSVNKSELSWEKAQRIFESRKAENPYFGVLADRSLSTEAAISRIDQMAEKDEKQDFIKRLIWHSCIGLLIGLFISSAERIISRNWNSALIDGCLGATAGTIGGVILAFIGNKIYWWLGGGSIESPIATQVFARTIIWSILGLFFAIAPGIVMRNRKKLLVGLLGGVAGGFLGGLLFDGIGHLTDSGVLSRFFGIIGIGTLSGVGIGLIENAMKTGWLKVLSGVIAGKQFIIYKNPTFIGSSQQCEIYLFKDPKVSPRHAAIHSGPQGYTIQNLGSGGTYVNGAAVTKKTLRTGDEISIGNTVLRFEQKERSSIRKNAFAHGSKAKVESKNNYGNISTL